MTNKYQGWQPIEGAPKDVYMIGLKPGDASIERRLIIGRLYDIRTNTLINEMTGRWAACTHWMPLPDAPPPEQEGGL